MTTHAYLDCKDDSIFCETPEKAMQILDNTLRGQLVRDAVKQHNNAGHVPHVIDLGPGEYWLPQGLRAKFLNFTYEDIGVNEYTKQRSKTIPRHHWNGENYVIFCAQEVIEHLFHVEDLNIEMMRYTNGKGAHEIHLSTPLYVYDPKPKPIDGLDKNSLPHLKGYTPQEFGNAAIKIFGPAYQWELHASQIMSLVGKRK
jgi:hypothetical protein